MSSWTINFGFTANAQSLDAQMRTVRSTGDGFARLLVRDIVQAVGDRQAQLIRDKLVGDVRSAVMSEIQWMAHLIGNYGWVNERSRGPLGQMSVRGPVSTTAQRLGWAGSMKGWDRSYTGIKWDPRQRNYLRRERGAGRNPVNWWKRSGELLDALKNPSIYIENFGPIQVRFRARKSAPKIRAIDPESNLERGTLGQRNETATGLTGRPGTYNYTYGTLDVLVFGKITPRLLPALASPSWDPKFATPVDRHKLGVGGLIRDPDIAAKLTRPAWKTKTYRPMIEPFVSYYLTRAIPNAVWRRTERLTQG